MSERYPGGFITKSPPALNPALGNAAPGIWTMDQAMQAVKNGTWPAYDPYFEYTTLLLHGNGTNGAQNNTFLDSSTNAFSITRNGNTTQGTFSPYGDLWSNYFDTSGDYLFFNNAGLAVTTQDFTAEAWVYLASTPGPNEANVLWNQAQSQSNASQTSWQLLINTDRTVVAAFFSGSTRNAVTTSATIPLGVWTHVAIIRNGSTYSVALNGTLTSSNFGSLTLNSQNYVYIGNALGDNNPQYQLNGYISSARYVRGSAVYTSNFTPPTAPLTAITNTALLTCQSNRFIDNSTNGYAITRTGDVSVQRFSPFSPATAYSAATVGGSGYFDGTGDNLTASGANTANAMGTGNWTAEAWIYLTSGGGTPFVFDTLPASSGSATGLRMRLNSSNQLQLWQYGSAVLTSSAAVTVNAWTHVALVKNSGTTTAYVNGVASGTYSDSGDYICGTNRPMVGSDGFNNGSENSFPGYISNLRLVKGTAVYTSSFTPPTSTLTSVSGTGLLLNFTNAGIIDNAMMNDLETVGNAQISTAQSKFGGSSLYFDGSGDSLVAPSNPIYAFGTGNFTFECWLYINALPGGVAGIFDTGTGVNASRFSVVLYSSGKIYVDNDTNLLISNASLSVGQWYHIAVARTNTGTNQTRIFINGNLDVSGTVSTNFSSSNCRVGQTIDNFSLNGYIDDLRITKGYARYTANFTPPTSQLQDQ